MDTRYLLGSSLPAQETVTPKQMDKATLTISTDNETQARVILSLLTEAEENGELDFSFGCRISEVREQVEFDHAL